MAKTRIDAPDTIDAAIRLLAQLQAEGWGLVRVVHEVDYEPAGAKAREVPVAATVTVALRPAL